MQQLESEKEESELEDAAAEPRPEPDNSQDDRHDDEEPDGKGPCSSASESSAEPDAMELESPRPARAVEIMSEDAMIHESLALARGEVDKLRALVQEQHGSSSVEVGELAVPDPAMASTCDPRLLLASISKDEHEGQTTMEQLGLLQRWWRLVERCYAAVAILDHLVKSKSKQHIMPLFNEMARSQGALVAPTCMPRVWRAWGN